MYALILYIFVAQFVVNRFSDLEKGDSPRASWFHQSTLTRWGLSPEKGGMWDELAFMENLSGDFPFLQG